MDLLKNQASLNPSLFMEMDIMESIAVFSAQWTKWAVVYNKVNTVTEKGILPHFVINHIVLISIMRTGKNPIQR
jgi:hypothetical protein